MVISRNGYRIEPRIRPILFNTEMVRAILAGRKTVTRRAVRPKYKGDESGFEVLTNMGTGERWLEKVDEEEMSFDPPRYIAPPYKPGDILYVRETWCKGSLDYGKEQYYYKADNPTFHCRWNPSIHMPKAAARIWLRVTDVKAERLQDIDGQEVLKEGVDSHMHPKADYFNMNQREMFEKIWNSTIKKTDWNLYGWEANPWVWVIKFERCEKPGKEKN